MRPAQYVPQTTPRRQVFPTSNTRSQILFFPVKVTEFRNAEGSKSMFPHRLRSRKRSTEHYEIRRIALQRTRHLQRRLKPDWRSTLDIAESQPIVGSTLLPPPLSSGTKGNSDTRQVDIRHPQHHPVPRSRYGYQLALCGTVQSAIRLPART